MTRRSAFLVAAIAVLLAASPLLHQHPLGTRSSDAGVASTGSSCVVCAAGVNRLPDAPPTIAAPDVVVYAVATVESSPLVSGIELTLPARAPPAA